MASRVLGVLELRDGLDRRLIRAVRVPAGEAGYNLQDAREDDSRPHKWTSTGAAYSSCLDRDILGAKAWGRSIIISELLSTAVT